MGAGRVRSLNPRSWLGRRSAESPTIPPAALARIHAQEFEMGRQAADGTFGNDATTASNLERKLLG